MDLDRKVLVEPESIQSLLVHLCLCLLILLLIYSFNYIQHKEHHTEKNKLLMGRQLMIPYEFLNYVLPPPL